MKFHKPWFYTGLLSFLACFLIWTYWGVASKLVMTAMGALKPFMIGAGIAYIVNIVMTAYEALWGKLFGKAGAAYQRPVSLVLSYLSFFALVFFIFSIVLPDLIESLRTLLTFDLQTLEVRIAQLQNQAWVQELLKATGQTGNLAQQVARYSQQILNQLLGILTGVLLSATSIASTVMTVFISLIFSIYVLASKESLGRQFRLLVDTYTGAFAEKIYYALAIFHDRFRGFFVSQSLEALILGSLTFLGMSLIGLPYAATIGVLIGFTAMIPVVGAYIGVVVGVILILTQSVNQAIVFLIFIVLLQQVEGNLIYPRVVGGSIGLPAIWVLVVITLGGSLAGILGMLIAVPVAASLYQLFKDYTYAKHEKTVNQ